MLLRFVAELKAGKKLGNKEYKVHLDGYDQTNLITGKGPSNRHEIYYFAEAKLGAIRIDDFKFQFIDQPLGWPGAKVPLNMPLITNLRQDPFERMSAMNFTEGSPAYMSDFYAREFWRFIFVQDKVKALADSAVEFPPMQAPASFNLEAIKDQVMDTINAHQGQ